MNTNLVEELKWRGMIHDIMPGTEEQLKKDCPDKGITYYDGKIDQCKELIIKLEGFKRLFN